jgi:hypothetical protein
MIMANSQAYYNMTTITAVISFILQTSGVNLTKKFGVIYTPGACTIKLFTAVIVAVS